jgi:hypothetical protein
MNRLFVTLREKGGGRCTVDAGATLDTTLAKRVSTWPDACPLWLDVAAGLRSAMSWGEDTVCRMGRPEACVIL